MESQATLSISTTKPPVLLNRTDSQQKPINGFSFKEILKQKIPSNPAENPNDIALIAEVSKGNGDLQPARLLVYQIKASEYRLKVELISKAAEAALTTVRKFQSGQ